MIHFDATSNIKKNIQNFLKASETVRKKYFVPF